MGLHHQLCHTLGGNLNLPHSDTHTVVLPRALSYNAPSVPKVLEIIAEVLPMGDGDAIRGLDLLIERLALPSALHELGMRESDIAAVVERVLASGYENPMPLECEKVEGLVKACWSGSNTLGGRLHGKV